MRPSCFSSNTVESYAGVNNVKLNIWHLRAFNYLDFIPSFCQFSLVELCQVLKLNFSVIELFLLAIRNFYVWSDSAQSSLIPSESFIKMSFQKLALLTSDDSRVEILSRLSRGGFIRRLKISSQKLPQKLPQFISPSDS